MPPRADDSEFTIARAVLGGSPTRAAELCQQRGEDIYSISKDAALAQSGARQRLASQASVRLLALHADQPDRKAKLFLFCSGGDAAQQQQAGALQLPMFQEDRRVTGKCEAHPTGYLSHSDASFNMGAEPPLARCGSDKWTINIEPQLSSCQVGARLPSPACCQCLSA